MKKVLFFALISSSLIFAQACNTTPKEKAEEVNEEKIDDGTTGIAGHDEDKREDAAEFVTNVAASGMMEVEAAQIAVEKATHANVKEAARMILDDHKKANDQLMEIARSKNITLPGGLSEDQREELNKLREKTGKEFDEKYVEMVKDAHDKDVSRFRDAAQNLTDPELKAFAASTLPTLEKHYAMLKAMDDKM